MNIEDVRAGIQRMQDADAKGDYEAAGSAENEMMRDFIRAVADGKFRGSMREAAKELDAALQHDNKRYAA